MTATLTTPAHDARIAARRSGDVSALRPIESARRLVREYGVTPEPEALRSALTGVREARAMAAEARGSVSTTLALADAVLDSPNPSKALADAGKRLAVEAAAAQVAEALVEAAIRRAVATYHESTDEIADAILGSDSLAAAFAEVEAAVALVPSDALAEPTSRNGLALASAVFALRNAAARFESLHVTMAAIDLLPDYGVPGSAALLYADPTGADPEEVRRALKGLRPGVPDVSVWTASAVQAPIAAPFAARGIPAALLAGTPGVVLSLATSAADFEARAAHAASLPTDHPRVSWDAAADRGGVVL